MFHPLEPSDTIIALATPPGKSGVAVLRMSGPASWSIASQLTHKRQFTASKLSHGWAFDADNQPIDEVLILPFQTPRSYTGEDVIELQGHGSPVLIQQLLQRCLDLGARPAQPGEFTQRAYLNGKMDLNQAEAVMDLISAQGEAMARLALTQLQPQSLSKRLNALGQTLLSVQAAIVASVDFPDEVDEPERGPLLAQLAEVQAQLHAMAESSRRNQVLREGFPIAILGRPNSGKSSLFNAMLATDRAIVSEFAGTTRDVLTEALHINGIQVTLVDTAGIRQTQEQGEHHQIERLGIERSWQAAQGAGAVLYVYDLALGLTAEDEAVLLQLGQHLTHETACLVVGNKLDQVAEQQTVTKLPVLKTIHLSAKTGEGVPQVFDWLGTVVAQRTQTEEGSVCLNQRQTHCLATALDNIIAAQETLKHPVLPIDLVTVPLSQALEALNAWTGAHGTEAMLSEVFSNFCVGK